MSDEETAKAAVSPVSGEDTLVLIAGEATLDALLQVPSRTPSAFESLRGLSAHLSDNFGARLAFVSCRDRTAGTTPQFLFDTARSAFAAERARLFALEVPLDIAIAARGRPLLWKPVSNITPISQAPSQSAAAGAAHKGSALVAVPYQCGPLIALCAVQPAGSAESDRDAIELIGWHCIQYLPQHFRYHPLRQSERPQILSPQEERIILKCSEGLTDKEIGRELELSPHTVRTHINSARAKLGAKNKTHAVMLFKELSAGG